MWRLRLGISALTFYWQGIVLFFFNFVLFLSLFLITKHKPAVVLTIELDGVMELTGELASCLFA
jgi:hypothetical protein